MVKVIFFDLGGVIFQDFFSGGAEFFARRFNFSSNKVSKVYVDTDSASYCKADVTDEQRWGNFSEEMGVSKDRISSFIKAFYESYQIFPDSLEFLQKLRKEYPSIKLGVLSDQPLGVDLFLRKNYQKVFSLFDEDLIIISAEVKMSKKDPEREIYIKAIKRTGEQPNDILFVDNSEHNIEDANKTGMQTVFFNIRNKTISELTREIERLLV